MWSLSATLLIEFGLGFLSGNHTFAYSFNEVVSCRVVFVCSWWEAWLPQGASQINIDLRRCHGCLNPETYRMCWESGHASSPIWLGGIQISGGLGEFVQGMTCWIFNAGACFEIVIHGQLQLTFLQRSFIGLSIQTGDWAGAECSKCQF